MDAGADAVLCGAAGRPAGRARGRPRIPARHAISARRSPFGSPKSRSALAGLFGVYALSQICVVVTYWACSRSAARSSGAPHAAMAVLLMVGIAVFTVPTPDFGPPILAMALWAVMLLHYWRAVGEGRRAYWLLLAVESGCCC